MSIDSSAIVGSALRAQSLKFTIAAENIATINTSGFQPSRVLMEANPHGGVNAWVQSMPMNFVNGQSHLGLANEMISQMSAQRAYGAQVNVLNTESAIAHATIDLIA